MTLERRLMSSLYLTGFGAGVCRARTNRILRVLPVWAVCLISSSALGATIHVPADFFFIQDAIFFSGDGDEIIVAPGTYFEAIDLMGKAINLHASSTNPADTIIDGTGQITSVVSCVSGEGSSTVFDGFTVTNGIAGTTPPEFSGRVGMGMFISVSSPTVTNCIFSNNSSPRDPGQIGYEGAGMAIWIGSDPLIQDCAFVSNTLVNTTSFRGGAVRIYQGNATFLNCTFENNSAGMGGAMSNEYGQLSIEDCTFSGNVAVVNGGAMSNFYEDSPNTYNVVNCTFTGNSAGERGGAIRTAGNTDGTISQCTFVNNTALNEGGGGIYAAQSNVTVNDCSFTNNYGSYGGGMFVWGTNDASPKATAVKCTFKENETLGLGGGAYVQNCRASFVNCVFDGNTATYGGGLSSNQARQVILDCLFVNNSASQRGGGIYLEDLIETQNQCPIVSNCVVVNNSVGSAGSGAGIQLDDPSGIFPQYTGPARISNCIVRDNIGGDNVWVPSVSFDGYVTIQHCNIEGPIDGQFVGSGNIDADPMFVDADGADNNPATVQDNDYHLLSGSPCIDSGIHWDLELAGITSDFDGNPRFKDGDGDGIAWVDMGMYEYRGVEATIGEFPVPHAYWHFNTFGGSSPIPAEIGTGSIDLSMWGGTAQAGLGAAFELNWADGTASGTSLRLNRGANGNGTFIQISFSMSGHEDLKVSFATRRSDAESFTSGIWSYSTNGVNFTTLPGVNTCSDSLQTYASRQVVDFSGIGSLDNAPSITLRYTLTGAALPDEFVTIDNLQINATPLPCPADIDGNGIVNIADLLAVISNWGSGPGNPADVNGDGFVNITDLLGVISDWGNCS